MTTSNIASVEDLSYSNTYVDVVSPSGTTVRLHISVSNQPGSFSHATTCFTEGDYIVQVDVNFTRNMSPKAEPELPSVLPQFFFFILLLLGVLYVCSL